jgi:pyridoxal phosphate enzyme (YggS family)
MDTAAAVERWKQVRAGIARAAADSGRDPASVTLVAVSKTFPAEAVELVLAAGQRVFGENYVQEAKGKWPALKERYPDVELHLIGPLQSNKAKDAVALFDVIHTLDRPSLAEALAKAIAKTGRAPRLLVQVNTGEEPQKGGVMPDDVDAFVAACRERYRLKVEGLMCIPPESDPPSPHFALLHAFARRNGLSLLSMGMSVDYPAAIQLGATHVRIGSAIFGSRT